MECQGLYISSDISHTSTTLAAVGSYYYMTKSIAESIGAMFQASFPDGMTCMKRHLRLVYGLEKILDCSSVGQLFTNFREDFTKIVIILVYAIETVE